MAGHGHDARNCQAASEMKLRTLYPESARLYDFSVQQYEQLAQELNFNIMFSQRGVMTLAHSRHDLDSQSRWANAMLCNGVAAELLDARQVEQLEPRLNFGKAARYPILGGFMQRRAGAARHDAVAWGYARGAVTLTPRAARASQDRPDRCVLLWRCWIGSSRQYLQHQRMMLAAT